MVLYRKVLAAKKGTAKKSFSVRSQSVVVVASSAGVKSKHNRFSFSSFCLIRSNKDTLQLKVNPLPNILVGIKESTHLINDYYFLSTSYKTSGGGRLN